MSRNINEEIMNQSRHQFIYGYQTEKRSKQIKEMVEAYPIKMDENIPMGINLENYAVTSETPDYKADKFYTMRMSKEYLSFSIAYTLLDRALETNDFASIPERVSVFLDTINRLFMNKEAKDVESLEELLNILKMGLVFYRVNYSAVVDTGSFVGSYADIPMSFLSLEPFVHYFKKMLNNNSYVAVVIDLKNSISGIATSAINDYLASRCNSDISMKVVCEPGAWNHYYNFGGTPVEYIHDYGVVELDESHQNCLKEIKESYGFGKK